MEASLAHIAKRFCIRGEVTDIRPVSTGHINQTTHLCTRDARGEEHEYIFQQINTHVFSEPDRLMQNVAAVSEYLRAQVRAAGGDEEREAVNLIPAKDGKNYVLDENGGCWRMLVCVKNSVSFDRVERPEQFYQSAVAFGNFQHMLRNFPAETLYETIPDFHNTPDRYRKLMHAVQTDVCGRASDVQAEISFAREREHFIGTLERAHEAGKLPLRVTHNDTKLNNILFDRESGAPVCIIDLDTIMPGYSVNDFGDSIRFGATTAAEDEVDLSRVHFDIGLYEMYVKGFIEGAAGGLSGEEIELLPDAAIMMTLECGMRFLTDHLSGDSYFRIHREGQNLDRARNQFKLVADMETALKHMRAIVKKYA